MKRNLILANVALLATALFIGVQLKSHWVEFGVQNKLQAFSMLRLNAGLGTSFEKLTKTLVLKSPDHTVL